MSGRPVDFALVDDLTMAAPGRLAAALPLLRGFSADAIGPAVEYAYHQSRVGSALPPVEQVFASRMTSLLAAALRSPPALDSTSVQARDTEFTRLPENRADNPLWRAYCQRLGDAGHRCGFDKTTSKGFAAAFGELASNVYGHSHDAPSGLVGYRWTLGTMEFVVADAGDGVLRSLQEHPTDYKHLKDHGEAIRVALSPGESRHGRDAGRGMGFDTLFRNLASLGGSLRFRSGDHSLEIDGTDLTLLHARLRQRSHYQGFLVSVVCRV